MKKVTIYTNETCPYCKQIKKELTEEGIKFQEKLTKDAENWADITNLTGIPTVPTIEYNDNYFVAGRDFANGKHLIDIIKNFKKSKFPIGMQNLEKMKTLTYNMYAAFGRVDQLLRQIESKLNIKEDEHKSTN
jgi:glutaredoxin